MSYNVRYGTAADGENSWPNRKAALLALVRRHDPDVLGVQEALADQVTSLRQLLPEHEVVGVGRDDGIEGGEFSCLFIRRNRFGVREGGTRWISDNPELPGSKAKGANLPRVFSWAILTTQQSQSVLVMNAHWDHQSAEARLLGATQMREFAKKRGLPTIMMGDFNCEWTSDPLKTMQGYSFARPSNGPYVTYNAFEADADQGDMIDHILYDDHWKLQSVLIDRTTNNGRVPSDHFPLIANLTLD
ncbi:MAG: endonuclease/exonuclease/phosphatase family protein [Fimbriimonas sp.]